MRGGAAFAEQNAAARSARQVQTQETVEALQDVAFDSRLRQAVAVTALLKLGKELKVTPQDAFKAAEHGINVTRDADGFVVALIPNERT